MATCTYGELIELLHRAELRCDEEDVELSELLVTLFKERYPSIYIYRSTKPVSRHASKDCSTNQTIYDWKEQVRWRFSSFLHETNMGP